MFRIQNVFCLLYLQFWPRCGGGFGSSKTSLTPPQVSCACTESGVEVISYICTFFMFFFVIIVVTFRQDWICFTYTRFLHSRARHKEWDSTFVEGLLKTSSLLIEFRMVDGVWSPLHLCDLIFYYLVMVCLLNLK